MNWTLLDDVGDYKVYARDCPGGCLVAIVSPTIAGGSALTFVAGTTVAAIAAMWNP